MKHVLIFLLLSSAVLAQAPTPPAPLPVVQALVASHVTGTGKRNDPYLFTASTKCALRLTGPQTDQAVWDTGDAPTDFEVLGQVGIFSLSEPGTYVVFVRGTDWHTKAWFKVEPQTPGPSPGDPLLVRVKAALVGPDAAADAERFGAACTELSKALDSGQITRLATMEASLKAALDAVGWVPGKYPALSALTGELFGVDVPDRPLDLETRTRFISQLRLLAQACEEISP